MIFINKWINGLNIKSDTEFIDPLYLNLFTRTWYFSLFIFVVYIYHDFYHFHTRLSANQKDLP